MKINTIKISTAIAVVLLLSVTVVGLSFNKGTHENITAGSTTGFAVVELFTSEGCSSCPAADNALETIAENYKDNVFVLSFHVDYWNRLGWKDAFSSAAWSERQRAYAAVFEKEGVYTPQAIVNGTEQFVGSDIDKLNSTIRNDLKNGINEAPALKLNSTSNNRVELTYFIKENPNAVLNIALVQLHAVTNVKSGENGGRTLKHVNIVREFKTVAANDATSSISFTIPAGLTAADCKLIAFVQDSRTFKTSGAAQLMLE